eukprot:1831773-Prymnesium_polylepis.1
MDSIQSRASASSPGLISAGGPITSDWRLRDAGRPSSTRSVGPTDSTEAMVTPRPDGRRVIELERRRAGDPKDAVDSRRAEETPPPGATVSTVGRVTPSIEEREARSRGVSSGAESDAKEWRMLSRLEGRWSDGGAKSVRGISPE